MGDTGCIIMFLVKNYGVRIEVIEFIYMSDKQSTKGPGHVALGFRICNTYR